MSGVHAVHDHFDEAATPTQVVPHVNGFHLEPRCRVCRNDQVRKTVNDLLATGSSYAYILRALTADGSEADARDRVTIDSIRNHCVRHFPVQQAAHATYREIVERRAQENRVDFVEGVATALTPLAFLEVVMNKAFRSLVDDDAEVSVDIGLRAAEKLQLHLDKHDQGTDVATMIAQVDRILDAVKSTVPPRMWGEIAGKLEPEHSDPYPAVDAGTEDDDDVFDPADIAELDDEL